MKAGSISGIILDEGATQIFVPAPEEFAEDSYFVAEHGLIDFILNIAKYAFQRNCLH